MKLLILTPSNSLGFTQVGQFRLENPVNGTFSATGEGLEKKTFEGQCGLNFDSLHKD